MGYDPSEITSLNLDAVWVGERKDWGDVDLASYSLINMTGSYRIGENLELMGRVENLLDEEYEEAAGYGTPGRSVYFDTLQL